MGLERLTKRENEVLALVAEHLTNRAIAGRLVIAESTVETHMHRILKKLRVKSRQDAARLLLDHGS